METFEYREQELDRCPRCGGLWLDVREFKQLTTECDVIRDESVSPEYVRGPYPELEPYLPCARCGKLMPRRNFGGISGIMIDLCRDHGCWMDAGELKQIRSFIAAGGLQQAQDKELAKHGSHLRSLETRVSDLELMQRMLHKWSFKRWMFQGF
jgi:Zn-finger nucleic acid-binding protein